MNKDLYTESDFVDTVDENGQEGPRVPKSWLGTEYAAGLKKKGRSSGSSSSSTTPDPDAEPAGNASRDDWAAYATTVKGAKPEDLLDGDGKDLGRDELREKYGTPAS